MKLYMLRTVRLSINSLFTVHSATVYVIQVCRQLSSRRSPVPVGFITKKFVTMYGHTNVKYLPIRQTYNRKACPARKRNYNQDRVGVQPFWYL